MNGNSTVPVVVEGGRRTGRRPCRVARAWGRSPIGSGLGDLLSARIALPGVRLPLHDRGKVLVQAMLMLAGGGEACSDIERLRAQPTLFGAVPSDSTLYRTVRSLDAATLGGLWEAVAQARGEVWRRSSVTTGKAPVVLDLDASLIDIHSENKEGTAANYKHGFGFSPMFCFADATGEALAGLLRPGNATANSIADQLAVLDAAVDQLPARIAVGHRRGDDPGSVRRAVTVRADSAGGSARLAGEFRARNIGFSVVARTNPQVQAAISRAVDDDSRWAPSLTQAGGERDGAAVAELTDLIDLSAWPEGTRLIVRREPLHPGAQTSLFPSLEFRFWGHYTDRSRHPRRRRRPHARPRPRRGPHPPTQSVGSGASPVHRPRRQPGLDGVGVLRLRPRPLVPAALPDRRPRQGRTQDTALAAVAHPGPSRAQSPPDHRAHPRRLARPSDQLLNAYRRVALIT